jgi:tropinone reductase I
MSVNFDSCFYMTQLAHPLLKAAEHSSIVNIGSVAGVTSIKSGVLLLLLQLLAARCSLFIC